MATFLYMPQYCGPLAACKTSCSKLLRSALVGCEVQWCCCLLPAAVPKAAVELNCSLPRVYIIRPDTLRGGEAPWASRGSRQSRRTDQEAVGYQAAPFLCNIIY